MTANIAGASLGKLVNWNAIDWQKANQSVSRLQARIVKATREGRWSKVKVLQRLLTLCWLLTHPLVFLVI